MTHTPKPWTAHYDEIGEVYDISNSTPNEDDELEKVMATVWANRPSLKETAECDARLIAAAPELLEALVFSLEFLEANDDGEKDVVDRIEAARAAIAKAKGEVNV